VRPTSFCASASDELYLREIGNGIPLVVIHGRPDFNHNNLRPDMDVLSIAFKLVYYVTFYGNSVVS
jgi:hypothetical protein